MVQVALNWCRALAQRRSRGCELQSRPGMSPLRCLVIVTAGVSANLMRPWIAASGCPPIHSEPLSVVPGLRGGFRVWTHHHREAVAVIAHRNDFVLRGSRRWGLGRFAPLLGTGGEGFLQQGIKRGPRQSMTGDLQEGARKRFASSVPQSGVVLAMFLLVVNGPDEPMRVTSRLVDALIRVSRSGGR